MILEVVPVSMFASNCIIIGDETTKDAIVVDPGDEADKIISLLDKHGLHCRLIVLTHAHIDHAGGTAALHKKTGAKVVLHEKDAFLFENLKMQANMFNLPYVPESCSFEASLQEGEKIQWGNLTADILHTPGHSPGSVTLSLSHDGKSYLICGDTLFMGSIGRTDIWGGNHEEIMASIKNKLLKFPDETIVVPGHGPTTTIGREKTSNPFILNN